MNDTQNCAMTRLQERLLRDRNVKALLPNKGEAHGYVFTDVEGVTVLIGINGSYKVPAVRTYPDGLEAAVNARVLWQKQKEADDADEEKARARRTGHLSPIIDKHLRCGNEHCPCMSEDETELQTRSLG